MNSYTGGLQVSAGTAKNSSVGVRRVSSYTIKTMQNKQELLHHKNHAKQIGDAKLISIFFPRAPFR